MAQTVDRAKARAALAKLRGERDQLADYAASVEAERDERPSKEDFAKLQTQMRGDRFRVKFEAIAKEAKIRPDAVEAAWKLSGIAADSDEPDAGKLSAAVKALADSHKFLIESEESKPAPKTKLEPGAGSERGAADSKIAGLKVERSNLADAEWCRTNQAAMKEAVAGGNLTVL